MTLNTNLLCSRERLLVKASSPEGEPPHTSFHVRGSTEGLGKLIFNLGLSEVVAMNHLQDRAIISDNCVWLVDIASADIPAAEAELRREFEL